MIEERGDIWREVCTSDWVVIATNGSIKADGSNVMGRGIALEAAQAHPGLPYALGQRILREGNQVFLWATYGLITLPTKHEFYKHSDLQLIVNGCITLRNMVQSYQLKGRILMPRLGCGAGRLNWATVKPIVHRELPTDQFIVFTR